MSQLDTPLPPQGRGGKTGIVGAAGKDARGQAGIGERAARGSAFSALLQSANGKAPPAGAARVEKGADAALAILDETGKVSEASLASDGTQPPASNAPAPASSLDAATLLLLGTLQPPVAARDPSQTRAKEPGPRRDAAMAALGSALADAGQKAARPAGPVMPTAPDTSRVDVPGLAMPSGETPIGAPDGDAMAALSALVDDKAQAPEAADADAAFARPVSVTIVRQETYLPPVARLSPFQQVVEPIRLAATELAATRTQSAPDLDPGKPAEIAAPTKVLHLELRPVELGSLLVKMRLTQGGMEIRIEASSAETARMLANDKEALREVVRASGFPVDAVSIETVHIDGLSADRQASGQDSNRNDQPDQRQGRGFDQSRQGEQQQEPRRRGWTPEASNREDVHDPDQAGRSGRDAHRYL
jgi:hypothetical protein